jgi:hypothetical protein
MTEDLKRNNKDITKFNTEVDSALVGMSQSLNAKYRQAAEFQNKVLLRMDDLEHAVFKSNDPAVPTLPVPGATQGKDLNVTKVQLTPTTAGRSLPELEKER